MDDTFDEDISDERSQEQQDWIQISERRIKDGYREGVAKGQEVALQDGFNEGFQEHLNSSLSHGFMNGVLSGLLAMQEVHGIPDLTESDLTMLRDFLPKLQQLKTKQQEVASLHPSTDITSTSNSPASTPDLVTRDVQTVTGDRTKHKEDVDDRKGDDSRNINAVNLDDRRDVIQRDFTNILHKLDLTMLENYQPTVS